MVTVKAQTPTTHYHHSQTTVQNSTESRDRQTPDRAEARVGQIVRFDVKVGGTPYPQVEWYHERRLLSSYVDDSDPGGGTICRSTSTQKSVIQIQPGPRHKFLLGNDETNDSAVEGRNNTICDAGNGYYHSLIIGPLITEDSGIYRCTVRNQNGQASAPIELTVVGAGKERSNFGSNLSRSQNRSHNEDFLSWSILEDGFVDQNSTQDHHYSTKFEQERIGALTNPKTSIPYDNNNLDSDNYNSVLSDNCQFRDLTEKQREDMLIEKRRYISRTSHSGRDDDNNLNQRNRQRQNHLGGDIHRSHNGNGVRDRNGVDKSEEYYVTIQRESSDRPLARSSAFDSSSISSRMLDRTGMTMDKPAHQSTSSHVTTTTKKKTTKVTTKSESETGSGHDSTHHHTNSRVRSSRPGKTVITIGIKGSDEYGDRGLEEQPRRVTAMRIDRGGEIFEASNGSSQRADERVRNNVAEDRVSHFYTSRYDSSSRNGGRNGIADPNRRRQRHDYSLEPTVVRDERGPVLSSKTHRVLKERREMSHSVERDTYHWLRDGDGGGKGNLENREHRRVDYGERVGWDSLRPRHEDREESFSYFATSEGDFQKSRDGTKASSPKPSATTEPLYFRRDEGRATAVKVDADPSSMGDDSGWDSSGRHDKPVGFENYSARAISPPNKAVPVGQKPGRSMETSPPPRDFRVDDSFYSLPAEPPTLAHKSPGHHKRGTVPPEFIQPFKPLITVTEGEKARFQAIIKPIDDPTLKVDWYVDGRPVPVGSRHKSTLCKGYLVLEIEPASKGDAGNYVCRLQNPAGVATCPATLVCEEDEKVEYKTENPDALEKIKRLETTGPVGHDGRAKSYQEPSTPIYYYPPTAAPSRETGAAPQKKLYYEPVEPVREPMCVPRFITHFRPVLGLPDGERAYFEARYIPTDDPNLKVEWFKDGKPILISSRINTRQEFGFVSLDINPASPSDSGVYSCVISNKAGSDVTKAPLECIQEKPERFTGVIPPPTYVPPKTIIHQPPCMEPPPMPSYLPTYVPPPPPPEIKPAPHPPAPPVYHYLPSERQRYVPPPSAPAPIPKVRKHPQQQPDSDTSQVLEENIMGTLPLYQYEQGPYVPPAPYGPPKFLTPFKNIASLREGARSHFEARLEPREDPKLTVEWLFNGKPIIIGSRHHYIHNFGFVALDIYPTYAEDSGTYMCIARNQYGQAVNTATLGCFGEGNILTGTENPDSLEKIIELEKYHEFASGHKKGDIPLQEYGPPMFLSKPKDLAVKEGDKAHFEAAYRPIQDPSMKIEWLYDGLPMKAGSRFKHIQDFGFISLDVSDCLPEDSGLYTIVIRNNRGSLSTDVSLSVRPDKSIDYGSLNPDGLMKIRALESHHQRKGGIDEADTQVPAIAPRFLTHIKDITNIPDGDSIHFEAKLIPENDPLLKVQWYFNGQPLRFGSRYRMLFNMGNVALEIHQISYSDTGRYECRAWNKYGEDWTRASLSCADDRLIDYQSINPESFREIQKMETIHQRHMEEDKRRSEQEDIPLGQAPRFTTRFSDVLNARQGDAVYFEARLEPHMDPNLKVEWFKDNQQLPLSCRITTLHNFGYVALKFSPIFVEDNGTYVCRAINNFGEDIISATLKCHGESSIETGTLNPDSMREVERLEAHYDASQHTRLPNGHNDTYSRTSTQQPQFLNEFGTVKVREGEKAVFRSKILPEKDPNLRVEWFLNGQPLIASDRYKMLNDFGYVGLSINFTSAKDIGTYECRLINTLGTANNIGILECQLANNIDTSSLNPESWNAINQLEGYRGRREEYKEQLQFGAPVFVKPLYGEYGGLIEGQTVRLEAFYEPYQDPKMKVQILKDGQPIISGSRFRVINEFGIILLEISDLTSFDSGIYEYRIFNAVGEASCKAQLHCSHEKNIYDKSINPDSLKQIQKLEEWEHRIFEKGFDDPILNSGSGGEYPGPLFLQDFPPQITLGEGQRLHLEARIEPKEDPDLKVEWFKGDKPLTAGNRFRTVRDFGLVAMDIMFVYPEDSGLYTCRLTNKQGIVELKTQINCMGSDNVIRQSQLPHGTKDIEALEANLNAKFNVVEINDSSSKYPPKFVRQLTDKLGIREGQRVSFECRLQPARDPNMNVVWLKNGNLLIASNRMNTINDFGYVALEIAAVFPEDEGMYSCVANNPLAEAITSAQLTCQAIPKIISDAQYPQGEQAIKSLESGANGYHPEDRIENQSFVEPTFIQALPPQLIMNEDNNAVFEIQVDPANDPNRVIKWYKNGNEIDASNRTNIVCDFGFLALYIKGVREDDTGIYTCRAVNPLGEAMTSTNLFVKGSKNISHESMMPDPESTLAKIRGLETWESIIDAKTGGRSKLSQRLSERKSVKAASSSSTQIVQH